MSGAGMTTAVPQRMYRAHSQQGPERLELPIQGRIQRAYSHQGDVPIVLPQTSSAHGSQKHIGNLWESESYFTPLRWGFFCDLQFCQKLNDIFEILNCDQRSRPHIFFGKSPDHRVLPPPQFLLDGCPLLSKNFAKNYIIPCGKECTSLEVKRLHIDFQFQVPKGRMATRSSLLWSYLLSNTQILF